MRILDFCLYDEKTSVQKCWKMNGPERGRSGVYCLSIYCKIVIMVKLPHHCQNCLIICSFQSWCISHCSFYLLRKNVSQTTLYISCNTVTFHVANFRRAFFEGYTVELREKIILGTNKIENISNYLLKVKNIWI